MVDLLNAFNGAIPVGALRGRILHDRQNKLVRPKKEKKTPVVKGGEDVITLEKVEDKVVDTKPSEVVKIETTQEEGSNEREEDKSGRKRASRRKPTTKLVG